MTTIKQRDCVITDVSPALILQQINEAYDGGPWPEDMEQRRKADLRKFLQMNPDYTHSLVQEANDKLTGGRSRGPSPEPVRSSVSEQQKRSTSKFWSVDNTLKLLEETKAFVRANKFCSMRYTGIQKWEVIAASVPNPYHRDFKTFANSCRVRFENIRRIHRECKGGHLDDEIRRSLMDYYQICELNQAPGNEKSA